MRERAERASFNACWSVESSPVARFANARRVQDRAQLACCRCFNNQHDFSSMRECGIDQLSLKLSRKVVAIKGTYASTLSGRSFTHQTVPNAGNEIALRHQTPRRGVRRAVVRRTTRCGARLPQARVYFLARVVSVAWDRGVVSKATIHPTAGIKVRVVAFVVEAPRSGQQNVTESSEGTRHELTDDSDAPAPKQAESESRSAVKSPTSAPPAAESKRTAP